MGGVIAGLATDFTGKSASTCAIMLIGAIPLVIDNLYMQILFYLAVSWFKIGMYMSPPCNFS